MGARAPFLHLIFSFVKGFILTKKHDLLIQLAILLAGVFLFIPFLGNAHLFDWDEINFAEAAREMLATGNFFQVQIDFKPFWEKPPLFMWLQAASMSVFGINEFAARFVNAFTGIITLLVVYRIGRKVFDRTFGILWAAAFAGSFMPHLFFKSGIIDPVFNLFIFLGIYFVFKSESNGREKPAWGMYALTGLFLGLATLTKGPVAILIATLCALVYFVVVRFKRYISVRGIVLIVATGTCVSLLWYGIETLLHGPWFVTEFVKYQIRLFSTGDAGHGRPFWFHAVILLFGCFPASFLALRAFVPVKTESNTQTRLTRWMLILFWVVLVLFSIVKTKTVLYSSLTYYPITFLATYHMHMVIKGKIGWKKWLTWSLAVFGLMVALVIAVFPIVMTHTQWITPLTKDKFALACLTNPVHWSLWETSIGLLYAAALVAAVVLLAKQRFTAGFAVLLASTALCLQVAMLDFVPKMELYTGDGPIRFYQSLKNKDCYARSLFKTYADLFYFEKKPGGNPLGYDREWLLSGPIDKPAYLVCRIDKAHEYRGNPLLKEIKEEYGFVYFVREPNHLAP
jgi:4-amino-4-deoxy-L-arabinose transferase-like glycosyltransferase